MSRTSASLLTIITCVLLVTWAQRAQSQEQDVAPATQPAGNEQQVQSRMPGKEHEQLAKLAGDWNLKMTLTAPGQEPQETTGTAQIIMTLEGRFLHQMEEGTMAGMPFKSVKITGYNADARKYESVWTYTGATSMLIMNGKSDDGGKTIVFQGQADEGTQPMTFVITTKIVDDDDFSIEMKTAMAEGPVFLSEYTRKK